MKINRWIQDLLSKKITREITHEGADARVHIIVGCSRSGNIEADHFAQGLDDTEISGSDYLADLRAFRDEMYERRAYWRQKLLRKKIVLSSDPDAEQLNVSISPSKLRRLCGLRVQAIILDDLPQGIENLRIAAHETTRAPKWYNFCPHRLRLRLNKRDIVVQVEVG